MSIIEQLEKRFDELAHTDIEKEREWFWYGVASYCKLKSEEALKDYEKLKE